MSIIDPLGRTTETYPASSSSLNNTVSQSESDLSIYDNLIGNEQGSEVSQNELLDMINAFGGDKMMFSVLSNAMGIDLNDLNTGISEADSVSDTFNTSANSNTYYNSVQTDIQLRQNTLDKAGKYEGLTGEEIPGIKSYNAGVWCANFVSAVLEETYGDSLPDWYQNCVNKDWCFMVKKAAESAGKAYKDTSKIQSGDLIIFDREPLGDDSALHIGFIRGTGKDGTIYTIEGNTGEDPGVVAKKEYPKNYDKIVTFIDMSID